VGVGRSAILAGIPTTPTWCLHSEDAQATVPNADLTRQREVVDAFLAASRGGDFDALLAVLDSDVVLRADRGAVPAVASREVRGATAVAEQALTGGF
jgi:ketosteroid isomerase-like protein